MVATVNPTALTGLAQAGAFAPRETREPQRPDGQTNSAFDSVSVDEAALSWRTARESVRVALADLDLSLAVGREVAKLVDDLAEAARAQNDESFQALLAKLDETVKAGVAGGAAALAGVSIRVQTERDVPPFEIDGLDLRLKETPAADDALKLSASSSASETAAREAADSLQRIQAGLDRLRSAAIRLERHDGFLASAETALAGGVRGDLDADSARLLALQVRQGLSETSASIASARPDSVLGLFRG